jgi:hypothetical protein
MYADSSPSPSGRFSDVPVSDLQRSDLPFAAARDARGGHINPGLQHADSAGLAAGVTVYNAPRFNQTPAHKQNPKAIRLVHLPRHERVGWISSQIKTNR